VSAVSSTLTNLLGTEASNGETYQPSEEEVREQLLIEQRILEQRKFDEEQ
jgi:hypothetical protein